MEPDIIDAVKAQLKELKEELSQLRKNGFNVKIPELKILQIPSKIQLAEITGEEKDILIVRQLLAETREEIESVKSESPEIESSVAKIDVKALDEELNEAETDAPLKEEENTEIEKEEPAAQKPDSSELKEETKLAEIKELIDKAEKHIEAKEKEKASSIYEQIMEAYKTLPKQLKAELMKDCIDLRDKLTQN